VGSGGVVDDALDFAAVDAEFAGYGALAAACMVPGPYRLFHRWCISWIEWCAVLHIRCRLALMACQGGCLCGVWSGSDEGHEEFEGSGQGQGRPGADQGPDESPWARPWARLAPMVAAMPAPRHQRARGGAGWWRRLASRMSMLADRMSPSTVKGSSLAVRPSRRGW
jgi:hypothetical protein